MREDKGYHCRPPTENSRCLAVSDFRLPVTDLDLACCKLAAEKCQNYVSLHLAWSVLKPKHQNDSQSSAFGAYINLS